MSRDSEDIPKLPRGAFFGKLPPATLIRIGMFSAMLYGVIALRESCASGVGNYFGSFHRADAGPTDLDAQSQYPGFELITAEEALKRWPDAPLDAGVTAETDSEPEPPK